MPSKADLPKIGTCKVPLGKWIAVPQGCHAVTQGFSCTRSGISCTVPAYKGQCTYLRLRVPPLPVPRWRRSSQADVRGQPRMSPCNATCNNFGTMGRVTAIWGVPLQSYLVPKYQPGSFASHSEPETARLLRAEHQGTTLTSLLGLHTVSERMPTKSAFSGLRCQLGTFAKRLHRHHTTTPIRTPDRAPEFITTSSCGGPCSCGLLNRDSDGRSRLSLQRNLLQHKFTQIATMSFKTMGTCHGHNEACCNIPPVVASGYSAKGSYEELGGLKTCKVSSSDKLIIYVQRCCLTADRLRHNRPI